MSILKLSAEEQAKESAKIGVPTDAERDQIINMFDGLEKIALKYDMNVPDLMDFIN